MKKKIEDILNDLSDSNDYNLKYITEHNYNELVDKLNALFSLHVVGCSLPSKEEVNSKLRQLDKRWELSKNLDEKQAFNHGFNSCIRWYKEHLE